MSDFTFMGSKITADGDCSHEKTLTPWKESYDQPRQHIKKQTAYLKSILKICLVKVMAFPVVMYGCESWTIKKLSAEKLMLLNCGVGEDSWGPLDSKEIQPVNPKGNQS